MGTILEDLLDDYIQEHTQMILHSKEYAVKEDEPLTIIWESDQSVKLEHIELVGDATVKRILVGIVCVYDAHLERESFYLGPINLVKNSCLRIETFGLETGKVKLTVLGQRFD